MLKPWVLGLVNTEVGSRTLYDNLAIAILDYLEKKMWNNPAKAHRKIKSSIILFCLYLVIFNLILGCSQKDAIKQASDDSCPYLPEKKITKEHKALFAILKDRKWGFIDPTGKVVIEPQFNYALGFIGQRAAFKGSNGKWGFIDSTGKVVVEPQFNFIGRFFEQRAAFKGSNGKWGFINSTGKVIVEPQFDKVNNFFREGKAAVQVGDKWGFVDSSGKIVIKPQFDQVRSFSEQRAAVRNRDWHGWGFIDPQGFMFVYPSFAFVRPFSEGSAAFSRYGKRGYIDRNGEIIIELPDGVEPGYSFSEGRAIVWEKNPGFQGLLYLIGEKMEDVNVRNKSFAGVIDKQGREIVPIKWNGFSYISDFSECLAIVSSKGKYGIIDRNGAIVVEPKFDRIGSVAEGFSEGLATVTVNNKQGFINTRGEIVIEPKFDQVKKFSGGLATVRVEKDGKWGAIDRWGNMVIEPQFPHKLNFYNGLARVTIDEKIGYIDRTGKFVWSPTK